MRTALSKHNAAAVANVGDVELLHACTYITYIVAADITKMVVFKTCLCRTHKETVVP